MLPSFSKSAATCLPSRSGFVGCVASVGSEASLPSKVTFETLAYCCFGVGGSGVSQ